MKGLEDITKAGFRYHVSVKRDAPDIDEQMIDGEEVRTITYKSMVSIMVYDTNQLSGPNNEPTIICKVEATGMGKTQRLAERDGMAECLRRVNL